MINAELSASSRQSNKTLLVSSCLFFTVLRLVKNYANLQQSKSDFELVQRLFGNFGVVEAHSQEKVKTLAE